ncbi:MAG TPA: MFS transporter [Pilimelia sp.]|nr:MFS transporter [Pilimelia sp.]
MSKILAKRGSRRPRTAAGAAAGAVTTTIASVLPVFLVGGLAVQLGAELRFSPAGLGLAVAVYFGAGALASVPAGALVERFGAAPVARAAILLSAACLLTIGGLARSYPALVAALAAGAAANALGQLASNAALSAYVPARRQGLSFGVKQAAIPLATLVAGAAVPTVALTLGWRWAFVLAAALALAALPAVPARPPGPGPASAAARGRAGGRATGALAVLGCAAMLGAAAATALGTFLVDAAASRGLAPGAAGLTLAAGSAVCAAARVAGGALADRPSFARGLGPVALIVVQLAGGALGLALLALPGTAALAAGVVLGFGFGWAWPGLMNLAVVRLHPQAPAAATSITQTGVYAGGCVGPLGLGALAAGYGYPVMWLAAAAALGCAAAGMALGGRMLAARASRPPKLTPGGR